LNRTHAHLKTHVSQRRVALSRGLHAARVRRVASIRPGPLLICNVEPTPQTVMHIVSIGFRAKTGRTIAVALTRGDSAPAYIGRWNVSLCDPLLPATAQPHHEVMELPWIEAQSAVRPIEARIENVAISALSALLSELDSKGCSVTSIGVVGSPDRNLERIGNPHIRAHAAEGILFRRVLEVAATTHKLRWRGFPDKDFEKLAVSELGRTPQQIKLALATMGHSAGAPWRVDERAAATAAWLTLPRA